MFKNYYILISLVKFMSGAMKKYMSILLLCITLMFMPVQVLASPLRVSTSKTLISNRAIATWDSSISLSDKRPVIVFLPGWGGVGPVNASISGQNVNFVNAGYVALAIGFDSNASWVSNIESYTKQGLDLICEDLTIPVNCDAILLIGSSYGGSQNFWVIEHIRNNGYDGGVGSNGNAIGFIAEDAGYNAPGYITDNNTGAFVRTGLADTTSYSVAMIENLGDLVFPVDECTWGNCGIRILSDAHKARGDNNVFSKCPVGGGHGTRGYIYWNAWVMSVAKTIIHVNSNFPTFAGYTPPTLSVSNECISESNNAILVNSVLPTSRTSTVGSPVTIFNTVVNAGSETASGVTLSMNPAPAGTFSYTQTSCATNAVIGAPNAPVDIAPGGVACYVLSFTPSAAFSATQVHIQAQASNASGTTLLPGINTWLLRATASQGPDIIALTTTTDFHQVACSGLNAFAVALSNVGTAASGDITVSANTGSASLPISVSIQETNPGTGTIIGDNILNNLGAGENRTVAVFVTFNGCVSFDPAANRIFIEFRDASNNVLGSTSTAVSTNR